MRDLDLSNENKLKSLLNLILASMLLRIGRIFFVSFIILVIV